MIRKDTLLYKLTQLHWFLLLTIIALATFGSRSCSRQDRARTISNRSAQDRRHHVHRSHVALILMLS